MKEERAVDSLRKRIPGFLHFGRRLCIDFIVQHLMPYVMRQDRLPNGGLSYRFLSQRLRLGPEFGAVAIGLEVQTGKHHRAGMMYYLAHRSESDMGGLLVPPPSCLRAILD
jgi:hypothetical protein